MDDKDEKLVEENYVILYSSGDLLGVLNEYQHLFNTSQQGDFINSLRTNLSDFYIEHIKQCEFYTKSLNLRNNKIVLVDKKENFEFSELKMLVMQSICIHNKWLIDLVKNQPYFIDLSDHDFAQIIFQSQAVALGIKFMEFRNEFESYSMLDQNTCLSKSKMKVLFGDEVANTTLKLQNKINEMKLTNREKALFFYFVLCNCDDKKFENKILYNKLKETYISALIQEFVSNNRDMDFVVNLSNSYKQYVMLVNGFSSAYFKKLIKN